VGGKEVGASGTKNGFSGKDLGFAGRDLGFSGTLLGFAGTLLGFAGMLLGMSGTMLGGVTTRSRICRSGARIFREGSRACRDVAGGSYKGRSDFLERGWVGLHGMLGSSGTMRGGLAGRSRFSGGALGDVTKLSRVCRGGCRILSWLPMERRLG